MTDEVLVTSSSKHQPGSSSDMIIRYRCMFTYISITLNKRTCTSKVVVRVWDRVKIRDIIDLELHPTLSISTTVYPEEAVQTSSPTFIDSER